MQESATVQRGQGPGKGGAGIRTGISLIPKFSPPLGPDANAEVALFDAKRVRGTKTVRWFLGLFWRGRGKTHRKRKRKRKAGLEEEGRRANSPGGGGAILCHVAITSRLLAWPQVTP